VLGLAASACAEVPKEQADDEQVETESQSIVYGASTVERPEVGALRYNGKDCTATLIGQREFLTAAGCINYASQARGGTFTINKGAPNPQTYTIERTLALVPAGIGGSDLAVGRLSSPVPTTVATPATVATWMPSNCNLTVMGYGCSARNVPDYGIKRYTQYYFSGTGTSQNLCNGDFGGPVFYGLIGERGPILRINSGLSNGFDVMSDPVTYRPQVMALATALEATGISYRAYLQDIGWQSAVTNGTMAGTMGQGRRLEAMQVWSASPGVKICYQSFLQDVGWQSEVCDGDVAGTLGQGRRMEAFVARLATRGTYTGIYYRAYLQGLGWQAWMSDNQLAGTLGQGRRIEAVQFQIYK
jgi:hypothetical protein